MNEKSPRITNPDKSPSPAQIETRLGREAYRYWKRVIQLIERNYPNVFTPEWLFGGKKHGWTLRYKKGKSFCTLIPEKNRFAIQIVFGEEERLKMETIEMNYPYEQEKTTTKPQHIIMVSGSYSTSMVMRLWMM